MKYSKHTYSNQNRQIYIYICTNKLQIELIPGHMQKMNKFVEKKMGGGIDLK